MTRLPRVLQPSRRQTFQRSHSFAMIHRSAGDCAQAPVSQSGMPAEVRVAGFIHFPVEPSRQKSDEIRRTQSRAPF